MGRRCLHLPHCSPLLPTARPDTHRLLLLALIVVLVIAAVVAAIVCAVLAARSPGSTASGLATTPSPGARAVSGTANDTDTASTTIIVIPPTPNRAPTATNTPANPGTVSSTTVRDDSFEADCLLHRADWGGRPAKRASKSVQEPVAYVIVQHTADCDSCDNRTVCTSQVVNIQNKQMDENGWSDIGYNFLVGGDGLVYEGRGWGIEGAHTKGWNGKSIGVGAIGTFTNVTASASLQRTLRRLLDWGLATGKLSADYSLLGACQVRDIASPGKCFMEDLRTWPHWRNQGVHSGCAA